MLQTILADRRSISPDSQNIDLIIKLRQSHGGMEDAIGSTSSEASEEECADEEMEALGGEMLSTEVETLDDAEVSTPASLIKDDPKEGNGTEQVVSDQLSRSSSPSLPGSWVPSPAQAKLKRHRTSSSVHESTADSTSAAASTSSSSPTRDALSRRTVAPLPRKSLAFGIYLVLPGSPASSSAHLRCPASPHRDSRPADAGTSIKAAEADSTPSSNSPGIQATPAFTFTCPLVPNPTTESAKSSVLEKLNARLLASGHEGMRAHSPIRRSHTSSSPLHRLKVKTKGDSRFKTAHERVLGAGGSIAQHWSLGRHGRKEIEPEAVSEGPGEAKKVRMDNIGSSAGDAVSTKTLTDAMETSTPGRPVATAASADRKTSPCIALQKGNSSQAARAAQPQNRTVPTASKVTASLQQRRKARSSMSASKAGKSFLIGARAPEKLLRHGQAPIPKAQAAPAVRKPFFPSMAMASSSRSGLNASEAAKPDTLAAASRPINSTASSLSARPTPAAVLTSSKSMNSISGIHATNRAAASPSCCTDKNSKRMSMDTQATKHSTYATSPQTKGAPDNPDSHAKRVLEIRRQAAEESRRRVRADRAAQQLRLQERRKLAGNAVATEASEPSKLVAAAARI